MVSQCSLIAWLNVLASGDQRLLTGSGSALEPITRNALYKSTFTLLYTVTMDGRQIGNHTRAFEWYQFKCPSVTYNRDFKVTIIQRQLTRKWYNIELYLQWPTNRKSYIIYRTAPLSMTLNDPYPQFYGRHSLNPDSLNISETLRHTDIFQWNTNRDLTCPTQQCHYSFWMILSDVAKYSMTWSVARSLRQLSFLFTIIGH